MDTKGLTRAELSELYRVMCLSRRFEEAVVEQHEKGNAIGNMHMSVGEEAVAAGLCKALTKEDYIASTHRCDSHLIAKGADINAMMAEMMGRQTGLCGGRAGKMHQSAPEVGFMSANGIVGASAPLGAGHALYCKLYAPGRVAVAIFGDGGGNQGAVHEAMNLAAVWKLPAVFVCENNGFAISTRVEDSTALGSFYQRAAGYGIPGVRVNGNDALEVYAAAKEAVARARAGEGPSYIECVTYRYRGHHEGDAQAYRTQEEVEAVRRNNDCIDRMHTLLTQEFGWTESEETALRASIEEQVAAAVAFALASPKMTVESMEENVWLGEVKA